MSEKNFSMVEKETICRHAITKLNEMSKETSVTTSTGKCMFIVLLVQALCTRDAGLCCDDNGGVTIKSTNKLNWYFEDSKMVEFVKDVVELRNNIVISYGLFDTLRQLDHLWIKPEFEELCNKLSVRLKR